jgi:lactate permease
LALGMFRQVLDPAHHLGVTTLLALVPLAVLLVLLAVLRLTAWAAALTGSAATVLLAVTVWGAPLGATLRAYLDGAATGALAVDWITLWGVVIFNTLVVTGAFATFRRWLIARATADVRVQAMLVAWAFGALLEGLVGFGYPWAVVAPILAGLGIAELDAIRVAAIANNAPVSFGALGAPIVGLAAVTGLQATTLAASVGRVVAVLALLPPWVLIYLVSGRRGLRDGWPLAVVGSLGYVVGQLPVSQLFGPYLPDVVGSLTCFGSLLLLLRFWRPREVLGHGGVPVAAPTGGGGEGLPPRQVLGALSPFLILIAVVVAWTGPWATRLTGVVVRRFGEVAASSIPGGGPVRATFSLSPFVPGTAILVAWLGILVLLRPGGARLVQVVLRTLAQMWGALLVGVLVFGLAFVFTYSGMGNSLAYAFSRIGRPFLLLAPVLGWIGVALSGSNTSTNALFGYFQLTIGRLLHLPVTLLPTLNSVGAEVGKPVAPQTASVGVSTSRYVRDEGAVIRHNLAWTLVILAYLVAIGAVLGEVAPEAFR